MAEELYAQPQIDLIAERGIKFLAAASQVPIIRAALERGGYTEEEHRLGWDLLLTLSGHGSTFVSGGESTVRQREAAAELDAWDGPNFDRARAALDRSYPEQSRFLFDNLSAKTGADAIASVRTFVERYARLRDGSDADRKAHRKQDAAAARLLASRRIIDEAEEKRLRSLVEDATSLAAPPLPDPQDPNERQQVAKKLDDWLADWRATARSLVTRRDHLIRLGLAERRTAKKPEPVIDVSAADPDS
jgi:hypothetical protein